MEKAWVPNLYKILYKTTIKKAKKGQIEGLPPVVGFLDQLLMHPMNENTSLQRAMDSAIRKAKLKRDKEGQRGRTRVSRSRRRERGREVFLGEDWRCFNIRGNSGYFCCPPNTPKIWGTPDCGPTSIEFQREQFQNATNIFLGSGTCVFINWGTFINRN